MSGTGITGWILLGSLAGRRISLFISGILGFAVIIIPFMFLHMEKSGPVNESGGLPVNFKKITMNKYR